MNPINGIVLDFNKDWILIKSNPVDYIIDGYFIIKNKNIIGVERGESEKWKDKIIKLKGFKATNKMRIPLDNLEKILKVLTNKFEIFTLYTKDDSICWLGRLKTINEKKLIIDDLNTKGQWNGQIDFKLNEIRVIEFDTDYINSLKLVSKKGRAKVGSRYH